MSATDPIVQIRLSELVALQRAAAANDTAARQAPVEPPPPPPPAGEREVLTTREAAKLLGLTVRALEAMRAQGRGPRHFRIGRAVRYRRADLVG